MRHPITRLLTLSLYAWILVALPAQLTLLRTGTAEKCACSMCRIVNGVMQHCSCCDTGHCTCNMTSGDDDQVVLVLEPATLPDPDDHQADLSSTRLVLDAPLAAGMPDLPVPTPPPKA